jgi:hypothetical protein
MEDLMRKNISVLHQKTLNVWDSVFDLRAFDNILVLAIGKADLLVKQADHRASLDAHKATYRRLP